MTNKRISHNFIARKKRKYPIILEIMFVTLYFGGALSDRLSPR